MKVAYERSNHKSAQKEEEFLAKATLKEIHKGWILVLPEDKYDSVPGLVLNSMGVTSQIGITPEGTFDAKKRVTHDLSFPAFY